MSVVVLSVELSEELLVEPVDRALVKPERGCCAR
jgi:hypothetical protein